MGPPGQLARALREGLDGLSGLRMPKARLQVLSFEDLEAREISRNRRLGGSLGAGGRRTSLSLTPTVLQLQSGAQGWDATASRRTATAWEARSPLPGCEARWVAGRAGAQEEVQRRHEVVLKHPAAKAMGPPLGGGRTGPVRAGLCGSRRPGGRPRSGLLRVTAGSGRGT